MLWNGWQTEISFPFLSLSMYLSPCGSFCVASKGFFIYFWIPHMIQQIRRCMKCLWQKLIRYWAFGMPSIGESQFTSLGFRSKVTLCTYLFLFEKQFLVSYWDPVGTQHFVTGHQVMVQSNFPITNSVLCHPTSYLGSRPHHQVEVSVQDWAWATLKSIIKKSIIKLHEAA